MIEIKLNSHKVTDALQRLEHAAADASPAMQIIAGILDDAVHENFEQQGRPKWLGLSPATQKMRARKGHWPGSILQQSGQLKKAIDTEFGANYAKVGVQTGLASKYAAMQQFGGTTSPRSMIPNKKIEARPFLSITDADEDKIVSEMNNYLRSVIG
jgi:phage virion morphogenesis protein